MPVLLNSIAAREIRRILKLSLHIPSAFPSRDPGDLVHTYWNDEEAHVLSHPHERAVQAIARGEAATIRSVILRLEVGVVYCRLAASSSDEATVERIRLRAKAALDSAVSAAEHLPFSATIASNSTPRPTTCAMPCAKRSESGQIRSARIT
jgi:hypothetical protein